jgi:cytochrome c-type biogenesis protein CcmH
MSSSLFWIIAAALVAAVLGMLLWPLLRQRHAGMASRKALNAAVYRDQIAELERDRASGALSEADYTPAREELQRRLLDDAAVPDEPEGLSAPRRATATAIALLVAVPLVATLLYGKLGNPLGLLEENQLQASSSAASAQSGGGGNQGGNPSSAQGGGGKAAGGNAGDLSKLADGLAAKLEKSPDNPPGWAMLGRTYKAVGRYDEAEKAFKRAGAIMESDPTLILEQAELIAIRAGGKLDGKPMELIDRALKLDPNHPQGLLLAGSAAYFRHDYATAVGYWEKMLKQLQPGSEDARALTASIDKAKSQMGAGQSGGSVAAALAPVLADNAAQSKPATTAQTPPAAGSGKAAAAGGAAISGRVELAPALQAKAAPNDALFIFARALSGPRMPLAVLRAKVSDLPMDFRLDDSMAMAPGMNLSAFPEVSIEAKISKSGDAMVKSGDLTGSTSPVKSGTTHINITINQVTP